MTYEDLYKPALSEYMQTWEDYFSKFTLSDCSQMNILQLKDELDRRKALLADIKAHKPEAFSFDIPAALEQKFASAMQGYAAAVAAVNAKADKAKQMVDAKHDQAVKDAEARAENSVSDLTKKYDQLLSYKDKVADVVMRFGIKPTTLSIDEDSLTREEMEALLDTALASCKFMSEDKMRQRLKILYEVDPEADNEHKIGHLGLVAASAVLLSPIILVWLFGYMYWHTFAVYKNVEGLRIADKLMYGVNFAKFRDPPKYEEIPEADYSEVEATRQQELERLSEGDPAKAKEKLQSEINRNHSKIGDDFRYATNTIITRYNSTVRRIADSVDVLQKQVDDYIANMKEFGTVCNKSLVMDTDFVLGKQKGTLDVKYAVGLQNIVFANRSPEMMLFIKLMLGNAMLSVAPKQFTCTIYDPEGLGSDFATYMSQDTKDYITVATNEFSKVLEKHREYSQKNLRVLDQQDINSFNKVAEAEKMVTLEYRLLIIVSGVEKVAENKLLTEFMQFSGRTGALVWLINPTNVKGCIFYKTPFDGVEEPYPVSQALFNRIANTYLEAFNTMKPVGILYKPSFADRYLPREKWWQENTDKGIKLNFGLQDGDPAKGFALELGDANVHGLCVGATGAGKSAFNNQLIASLVTRYAPSALELVMIDFKNIEFGSLVNKKTHISRIPHARIIAGTKDGEYAISVFDYLMQEMDRRTRLFDAASVKKIEEYNKKMRALETPEKCIPRILLLIDEFQVMFTEVDPKSVEIIQARIRSLAKLARFCGCHMFFTSQSMKGTMPKDILDQFSLRVALRCSSDTSSEIIGSPVASQIKQKFGYLYTNTNAGETQDSTRLWRTPFIPNEDLFDTEERNTKIAAGKLPEGSLCILDEICTMAEEQGETHHHAYFYDENEMYPSTKLVDWLKAQKEVVQREKRLIVLGERTGFSLKPTPVNFKLKKSDSENILFYAFEESDFNNMCMTLAENIMANEDAQLLINCADPDLFTVLDIPNWYNPDFLDVARPMPDVSEWLNTLQDMIINRQQSDPDSYAPLYFMALRWDKQLGISRDENYKLSDQWKWIITNGPQVDVHIIYGAQLYKEIKSNTLPLFNHIICARGPEEAGFGILGSGKISKLPDSLGFAIYRYGSADQKFKIYQHTFTRKAESRELEV